MFWMMSFTRVSTLKVRNEFRAIRRPLFLDRLFKRREHPGDHTLRSRALPKQLLRSLYADAHLRLHGSLVFPAVDFEPGPPDALHLYC